MPPMSVAGLAVNLGWGAPPGALSRAPALGEMVRRLPVYLECRQGNSSKFWEILCATVGQGPGAQAQIGWGRIGASGSLQIKSFPSLGGAVDFARSMVDKKEKKGYKLAVRPHNRSLFHPAEMDTFLLVSTERIRGADLCLLLDERGQKSHAWLTQVALAFPDKQEG